MPLSHAPSVTVPRSIPVLLGFVAGAVDACTFLSLFGLFVAQVTGSFVIIGAALVAHDPNSLIRVLAIPVFYIAGAAAVFLVAQGRTALAALAWVLAAEVLLLAAFVGLGMSAAPFPGPNAPTALAASILGLGAMGMQSAVVRLALRGVASTNVMTTNTTQIAIDLTEWLIAAWRARRHPEDESAERSRRSARQRSAALAPIMAGFFAGTLCGAVGFAWISFLVLLPVIGILIGLTAWAVVRLRRAH